MRKRTICAVFDAAWKITKLTAAFFAECIQRTVAEKTVEVVRICVFVTGEIFTVTIAEKLIMSGLWPFHVKSFQTMQDGMVSFSFFIR